MKRTTHIERMRQKYAYNQRTILSAAEMNLREYHELIFEMGIQFLEEHYPRYAKTEHLYLLVSREKRFWDFWRFEWMKWENDLIEWLKDKEVKLSRELYLLEIPPILTDQFVEERFLKKRFHRAYREISNTYEPEENLTAVMA